MIEDYPVVKCRMCDEVGPCPISYTNPDTGEIRGICLSCVQAIDTILHAEPECENTLHEEDAKDTAQAVKRWMEIGQ